MKKLKIFKFELMIIVILSVTLSVVISTWFSMHYMSHLYRLQNSNSDAFMNVNKRIDLIEGYINYKPKKKAPLKVISL